MSAVKLKTKLSLYTMKANGELEVWLLSLDTYIALGGQLQAPAATLPGKQVSAVWVSPCPYMKDLGKW